VFSRSESLYNEENQMKELSRQLAGIRKSDTPEMLEQARQLIIRLQGMNRRWNIEGLERFLRKRQKELFF
jgi:hypothetical protein